MQRFVLCSTLSFVSENRFHDFASRIKIKPQLENYKHRSQSMEVQQCELMSLLSAAKISGTPNIMPLTMQTNLKIPP